MLGQANRQKRTRILQTNSGQDVLTLGEVGKDSPSGLPGECAELSEGQALEGDHWVADRVAGSGRMRPVSMVTVAHEGNRRGIAQEVGVRK